MIVNRTGALLGERHLKAIDLARGAGINYNTAHGLYSGRTTRFDADVLNKVCKFLGVQVGDILVYVPDEQGIQAKASKHRQGIAGAE